MKQLFIIFILGFVFESNGQMEFISDDQKLKFSHVDDSIILVIGEVDYFPIGMYIKYKKLGDSLVFNLDSILTRYNMSKYYIISYPNRKKITEKTKFTVKNHCKIFNDTLIYFSKRWNSGVKINYNKINIYNKVYFNYGEYYSFLIDVNNVPKSSNVKIECFCGHRYYRDNYRIVYLKGIDKILFKTNSREFILNRYHPIIR